MVLIETKKQQRTAMHMFDERSWCGGSGTRLCTASDETVPQGSNEEYSMRYDLAENAFLSFSKIQSSGPPSMPLTFPEPSANRALTVSADVIDHNTRAVFRASSIMMRRPNHCKSCLALTPPTSTSNSPASASAPTTKTNSRDAAHSWHSAFNAPLHPSVAATPAKKQQALHARTNSNTPMSNKPCQMECDLPDFAYCVKRKICDTTYGSIKLCVVLRRVNRNMASVKVTDQFGLDAVSYPHHRGGRTTLSRDFKVEELDQQPIAEDPMWETTDEIVAVKVINLEKYRSLQGKNVDNPINELAALQLLGNYHPNLISLVDALQNESHLFIVTPYIPGGDLSSRIIADMENSPYGRVHESQAKKWFQQVLSAISHLQKKGVCHRDLSMDNIVVDDYGDLRILDFGLCLRVPFADPNNRHFVTDVSADTSRRLMKAQGQAGQWAYMSPEVAMNKDVFDGFAVDLWSAGILLFEILVGKKPFAMPHPDDANFRRISIERDLAGFLHAKNIDLGAGVVDMLQKMLVADPHQRSTLSDIVDHPWMRGHSGGARPQLSGADRGSMWFVQNNAIDDAEDMHLSQFNRLRADTTSTTFSLEEKEAVDENTVETVEDRESPYSDILIEPEETNRSLKRNILPSKLRSKSWWQGVMKTLVASLSMLCRQKSKKEDISTLSGASNELHATGSLC